ncbi:MAG: hypothetical protein SO016_06490 [Lachnospiraceae bacterium]|nr:hypothetical protein [Lachnospiraceae bacterium]
MKRKILAATICAAMCISPMTAFALGEDVAGVADPENVELDLAVAIENGVYSWEAIDEDTDGNTDYYILRYVAYEKNITSPQYQYMNIVVPAGYFTVEDGAVTGIDKEAEINGYSADSAPIIFNNECSGWNSSTPFAPGGWRGVKGYTENGFVYISCGARSRNDTNGGTVGEDYENYGKAPTAVADLKAGLMFVRANADVIPGDKDRIFSEGTSGGGEMSSVLGASGNMEEYYPYLYAAGAVGVTYDEATDTYSSEYEDSVFGCQCFCPIADIENADMAFAWMHMNDDTAGFTDNSTPQSSGESFEFTEFQMELQKDLGYAFCTYINSLNLVDFEGNALTFDEKEDGTLDPRSGSYYDAILKNMASALEAYLAAMDADAAAELVQTMLETNSDENPWLTENEDGSFTINDLDEFIQAPIFTAVANRETGETITQSLAEKRNKDIPSFDTFYAAGEGDSFGYADQAGVHFSTSVAQVLKDHYDKYQALDGFEAADVDEYIAFVLESEEADYVADQVSLMNATHILLDDAAGLQDSTPAQHWRTRNGTADEHTSFTIAYDICLAAAMNGLDVDYSLVWAMTHGSNEGTTTGTLTEWINSICQ